MELEYQRILFNALKGFQQVRSELVKRPGKRHAIQIIHPNWTPGAPVRQFNNVVEVDKRRYFVAYTVLKEGADK